MLYKSDPPPLPKKEKKINSKAQKGIPLVGGLCEMTKISHPEDNKNKWHHIPDGVEWMHDDVKYIAAYSGSLTPLQRLVSLILSNTVVHPYPQFRFSPFQLPSQPWSKKIKRTILEINNS